MNDISIDDDHQGNVMPENLPMVTTEQIMMRAVENGNVEALEKLIDLRAKEEARQAKLMFAEKFADMQAEFEPIKRTKSGDRNKYAPLEVIQRIYGPIISKYNFSYWWDEELVEDGGIIITMTISGYGHQKECKKFLPRYEPDTGSTSGKPIMNAMQAEGVRSTYGKRYTFKNGFGISEEDEDTDGNLPKSPPKEESPDAFYKRWSKRINDLHIDDGFRASLMNRLERAVASKNLDEANKLKADIEREENSGAKH